MKQKGKQQHSLMVKNGSLLNPSDAESDGLMDVIKLKASPKFVHFFDFLVCIDQSGNPFIFYHQKNRYINVPVPSPATIVAFIDNKGGQLAIALKNYTILIASLNGRTLKTLKGHEHSILNLHVNHAQNFLLAVSQDACVLYSLESFDKVHSLFAKGSIFVNACFMPSATELATIFADKTLSIWNLSSFEVISRVTLPEPTLRQCQMLPSIDGNNLLINTYNKIYIVDSHNTITSQLLTQGYGNGAQLIKSVKKSGIFILTKNSMLLQIDRNGNVVKRIDLEGGKTATHFDVHDQRLAVVLNTGEIMIFNLNKIGQVNYDSTVGNTTNFMIKENYPDTINFNNTTQNIDVKKVNDQSKLMQISQSTISKKHSRSMSQQRYNEHTLAKSYKNSQNPLREILNYSKLESFIKQFNVFPDEKRNLAWRSLLNLPMNQEAYNNLLSQGIHPAYANLAQQYPLKSESLFSRLQRTLSCLAYYCPLFAEVDYLPSLVFPFVKLFKRGEELLIFEVTLSILIQFCQRYFENFPNASISLMLFHDQVFTQTDPDLFNHMKDVLHYQCVKHAWPYMRALYTNLLTQDQWLQLMDFFMLHNDHPQMMVLLMVQYFRYFRATLLRMNDPEQLELFFNRQNTVEVKKLAESTLLLSKSLDYDMFETTFEYRLPLQKEQYQIFNVYPKNSVAYQARIREQLSEEEQRIYQKQQQIQRLKQMTEKLAELDQVFTQKQQLAVQAERDRQEMFDYQVEMRAQQQFQQEHQQRQQRMQQLQDIEAHMNSALQQQLDLQQKEQDYLNQQFRKTQLADNLRLQSAQEEETLQQLEYQIFQKFAKSMEMRQQQEQQRKIQAEMEFRQKQKEYADQIKSEQWKTDSQTQQLKLEQLKQQKMQHLQELSNQAQQEEAEYHQMIQQFQHDLNMIQLEREKRLREQIVQDQIEREGQAMKSIDQDREKNWMRRQQMEQQLKDMAREHEEKLRYQQQQLMEQYNKGSITQSSGDQREPMTSQKKDSALYDYPSSQKYQSNYKQSMSVEEERDKFTHFKEQLRSEINNIRGRQHDEQIRSEIKQKEQDIIRRTQQIREKLSQEKDYSDQKSKQASQLDTGQFQQQFQQHSPGSSQYSLYQPQQQIEIDQLSDSQLTYSSGFTSQRY